MYLSKLPPVNKEQNAFYFQPLINYTEDSYWYSLAPLGHNKLKLRLKDIFTKGGLEKTNKSNHSLRATAITRMYEASVPEKMIMGDPGTCQRKVCVPKEHHWSK